MHKKHPFLVGSLVVFALVGWKLEGFNAEDIKSVPLQFISFSAVPDLPFAERLLTYREGSSVLAVSNSPRMESFNDSQNTCPYDAECTFMSKCQTLRRIQPATRCEVLISQGGTNMRLPGGICCRRTRSTETMNNNNKPILSAAITAAAFGDDFPRPKSDGRKSGHLVNFLTAPNAAGTSYNSGKSPLILLPPNKDSQMSFLHGQAPVEFQKKPITKVTFVPFITTTTTSTTPTPQNVPTPVEQNQPILPLNLPYEKQNRPLESHPWPVTQQPIISQTPFPQQKLNAPSLSTSHDTIEHTQAVPLNNGLSPNGPFDQQMQQPAMPVPTNAADFRPPPQQNQPQQPNLNPGFFQGQTQNTGINPIPYSDNQQQVPVAQQQFQTEVSGQLQGNGQPQPLLPPPPQPEIGQQFQPPMPPQQPLQQTLFYPQQPQQLLPPRPSQQQQPPQQPHQPVPQNPQPQPQQQIQLQPPLMQPFTGFPQQQQQQMQFQPPLFQPSQQQLQQPNLQYGFMPPQPIPILTSQQPGRIPQIPPNGLPSNLPVANVYPQQPVQKTIQSNPQAPQPAASSVPNQNPTPTFCGIRDSAFNSGRNGRILGGRPSEFGSWPWMAVIESNKKLRCGATVLNEQFLITAAHCVYKNFQYGYYQDLTVRIGEYSLDDDKFEPFPPQEIRILRVYIHPYFNATQSSYDIALIQAAMPIVFRANVKPVCLPSSEHLGETGTVLGWGKRKETDDRSNLPTVLQEVNLPILYPWQCILQLRSNRILDSIGPQFICAGGRPNQDACRGDSGGPLLALANGQYWEMVGIVSKGYGCGKENVPGIYTNIFYLKDWIEETVSANWNMFSFLQPYGVLERSGVGRYFYR